jgi:hypothetical protein
VARLRLGSGVGGATARAKFLVGGKLQVAIGTLQQRGAAEKIYLLRVVLLAGFVANLLASGLRLLGAQLLLLVGSAGFAEAGAVVPAHFGAHPLAAVRTLLKVLLALGHGGFEGFVVGGAAHGPLNVVSRVFDAAQPAKEATCRLQQTARNTNGIGLKPRQVAIAALVAVKLELKAFVG